MGSDQRLAGTDKPPAVAPSGPRLDDARSADQDDTDTVPTERGSVLVTSCPHCATTRVGDMDYCPSCGHHYADSGGPPHPPQRSTDRAPELLAGSEAATSRAPAAGGGDGAYALGSDPILSRLEAWAAANPRALYAAAAVMLAPFGLVLLGLPASTAIILWSAALAVALVTKLYWASGRSLTEDWPRFVRAFEGRAPAAPSAPALQSSITARTAEVSPLGSRPLGRKERALVLRCPDCAEDLEGESDACSCCGHRFSEGRISVCRACDRRVEATARMTCPECGGVISPGRLRRTGPVQPSPPPTTPSRPVAAMVHPVAAAPPPPRRAYWGARLMILAGCIAVAGVYLPWITAFSRYEGTVSANGVDVLRGDGHVAAVLALLIVALGVIASRQRGPWMRVGVMATAVLLGAIILNDYRIVQALVREIAWRADSQAYGVVSVSIGIGPSAVVLAAILAFVAAIPGPPRS
jgi:hypothetical protein